MNLLVVGLNHRSAPVEVREQLAFAPGMLGEATCHLLGAAPLSEAAILSTCNRVEVYGLTRDVDAASAGIRKFLSAQRGVAGPIDAHLYEHHGGGCVAHVLDVACGLDSMVLGETEILGQMKGAYEQARLAGATGAVLNRLFQKAFRAAKQIRSETAIARGSTSVGNVAVDLAGQIFQDLSASTVMVLGTGDMSEATARALHSRGAGMILVCSRTRERAELLASQMQGRAIGYDDWPREFAGVDIVISATAAPHPIITRDKLRQLLVGRSSRPLFLIDIAVPRDVERACGELDEVYLYDIDDLQQIAGQNVAAREREIAVCRELIAQHQARFMDWFAGRRADDTVLDATPSGEQKSA
jgi:glutamyl-tRNA reductase